MIKIIKIWLSLVTGLALMSALIMWPCVIWGIKGLPITLIILVSLVLLVFAIELAKG